MKVTELFEDAKAPLVWSMISKILKAGDKVRVHGKITTWNNALAKNNSPKVYPITGATFEYDKFQKNESYRLYFKVDGDTTKHWFEVMHSDDGEMKLAKQPDGNYLLSNKDGTPIVA